MKNNIAILMAAASVLLFGTPFAQAADPAYLRKDVSQNVNWNIAVKNYIHALRFDNVGVRRSAVYFLGEYKLKESVEPLIAVLKDDAFEQVRMAAAIALLNIGDRNGVNAVMEVSLYDQNNTVAEFCASLLAASEEKLGYSNQQGKKNYDP